MNPRIVKWGLWLLGILCVYIAFIILKKMSSKIQLLKNHWIRFYLAIPIGLVMYFIIATIIDNYVFML